MDDPTNDGPTVHVSAPVLRSLADASLAEPTSGTQSIAPDVFSATTRRSPAVYIVDADAQTKRIVAAIWALAGVLLMWLGWLVYGSLSHS